MKTNLWRKKKDDALKIVKTMLSDAGLKRNVDYAVSGTALYIRTESSRTSVKKVLKCMKTVCPDIQFYWETRNCITV